MCIRRDAVANSLQELQTCVRVGVVPLQTHLYALVIDDIGLLLCPPYCHSTTGASNVCLTVYGCTLKVRKKCEDVRVCKLDSRPERRMKALKNIICMRRVIAAWADLGILH